MTEGTDADTGTATGGGSSQSVSGEEDGEEDGGDDEGRGEASSYRTAGPPVPAAAGEAKVAIVWPWG